MDKAVSPPPFPSLPDAEKILLRAEFADPVTEAEYRRWHLPQDRLRMKALLVCNTIGSTIFIVTDHRLYQWQADFWMLVAMRCLMLGVIAVTIRAVWNCTDPVAMQRAVFRWTAVAVAFMLCIILTRPIDFTGYLVANGMAVLVGFVVVPLPLRQQMLLCGGFAGMQVVLGYTLRPWPDPMTEFVTVYSFVASAALGAFTSWEVNRWKRKQFATLRRERELRRELERIIAEVRTLRGLLPICTHCKRIWNDDGFWQQLETYVRDHTHAEFTHGVCPDCARAHYPHVNWDAKRRSEDEEALTPAPSASPGNTLAATRGTPVPARPGARVGGG